MLNTGFIKIVPKLWGEEHWIVNEPDYCGKILILKKGYRCSLHAHYLKKESFFCLSGKIKIEINDFYYNINEGMSIDIPVGAYHRFTGLEDSQIIEFSTHHEDSDSYRLEPSGKVEGEK
jgi:mannose-6-phosphate isomerase-like protein (cupin superfamily)